MASVNFNGVFVVLAASLASGQPEYIFAGSMGSMGASAMSTAAGAAMRSDTRTSGGQVRQYANGTFRLISTVGEMIVYTLTLRDLAWAQVQTMDSWHNQMVLVRDRLGRRWWGSYPGIAVIDYPGGSQLHDCVITFTQVSYSEAV